MTTLPRAAAVLLLTAASALPSLALAPARGDDSPAPKGDLAKIQGTWTLTIKRGDQTIEGDVTFKGKEVSLKLNTPDGQTFEMKGEIVLADDAKPHKTIDWVKFTRPNGEDAPENKGIYTFEDDNTLKVCNGGPGNDRPAEFKASEDGGSGPNLFVLKRKGDAKK